MNPLIYCSECYTCRQGDRYICENLKLIGIDCDGGFAEYCLVPEKNILLIPEGLSTKLAAITEPIAVGVHAVRGAGQRLGDRVLITGAGPIGLILAECCRSAGAGAITIAEVDGRRAAFAASLGHETVSDLGEHTKTDRRYDIVYDTTGAAGVLPAIVELVRIKGTVAIIGKFDFPAPLNLHDILFKEITVKGLRVYREEEFQYALTMLQQDEGRFRKLMTDTFALEDIQEAISAFSHRKNLCKIIIKI